MFWGTSRVMRVIGVLALIMAVVCTIGLASVSAAIILPSTLNENLTAFYNFEETTGNLTDLSGNDYDGTIEGGVIRGKQGIKGSAYYFDGGSGYVNISSGLISSGSEANMTVSLWINVTKLQLSNRDVVFSGGNDANNGTYIRVNTDPSIAFGSIGGLGTDKVISSPINPTGEWYHIVGSFNGTSMNLFVNGILNRSNTTAVNFASLRINYLGVERTSNWYNGSIDQLGVWGRALTDAEILTLYNNGLGVDETSVTENSQEFNRKTIEGNLETFVLNISYDDNVYTSATANLIYNNTATTGARTGTGGEVLFTAQENAPLVITETNISFYWEINLTNATGTELFNSTSYYQVVQDITISNCSQYGNIILNFSSVDEEEQTTLVTSNDMAINIYNSDRTELLFNFSESRNVSNFGICSSISLLNTTTYLLDATIKYTASNYAVEYYNIFNLTYNNNTGTQSITLFDVNATDSTEFQLTFTGSDYLPVEDALVIVERQYLAENVFKTVELPLTDANGQTVLHLIRNDIIYNIIIMKDGTVLGTFESITAFCEDHTIGDCTITLNAADSTGAVFDYDDDLGITFTGPTFTNSTRTASFSFLTTDGTARTVLMEVERNNILGNRSICSDTLTSAGGTLSCSVPIPIESEVRIIISVDGQEQIVRQYQLNTSNYGEAGYLVFFVMAISLVLMFSGSKSGVLWGIILSIAAGMGLGLISGDVFGLGASALWFLLVVLIGWWRLNKERQQ